MTIIIIAGGLLLGIIFFISKNKKKGIEIQKSELLNEISKDFKICISKFNSNYQLKLAQKLHLSSNSGKVDLREALHEMNNNGELKKIIEQGITSINTDIYNLSEKIFDLTLISINKDKEILIINEFPVTTLTSLISSDIWLEFYNIEITKFNDEQIRKLIITLHGLNLARTLKKLL